MTRAESGSESELAKSRRKKRRFHAALVRLLTEMKAGDHGLAAEAVGEKWLDKVKRCPGVIRRHGPCGNLSFYGCKCDFPLCPWCQARRSRRLLVVLAPLVSAMLAPKLWTFSPPNIQHLTGGAVSAHE